MVRTRVRLVSEFIPLVCLFACGPDRSHPPQGDEPERYARKICQVIESCGCVDYFGSTESCETFHAERFQDFLDRGFRLDAACFEQVITDEDGVGCVGGDPPESWGCIVLERSKATGETCSDHTLALPPLT